MNRVEKGFGARARYAAAALAACACWAALPTAPRAQDPDRVTIDARRCREIASADERLACFEKEVDAAQGRGTAAPPADARRTEAPPSAEPAPSSKPSPSSEPPVRAVELGRLPAESARPDAPGQTEWVGTIVALRDRAPNQHVITLDGGQVFLQRIAERYPLRVGQRVRIYHGKIGGGLRLKADGVNGFIQVDLVR